MHVWTMNFSPLLKDVAGVVAFTTHVGFNAYQYADAPRDQVACDIKELAKTFDCDPNNIIIPRQTHSTNVAVIKDEIIPDLDGVDAVVCSGQGRVICVNTADCVPLLMVDPVSGISAAVHSGWRGTVGNIAGMAVVKMMELGACPGRIMAAMGPCISVECFEVGEEVACQFPDAVVLRDRFIRPHVNLAQTVLMQLVSVGVCADNISLPVACSVCNHDFYSVRRQGRELFYRTLTGILLC